MASIIDKLPGIPMPISAISKHLSEMWKGEENPESAAPSEFRASQLNLIIHFGLKTTEEEALGIFNNAIDFTQRHPGRIIILAPKAKAPPGEEIEASMHGKLFTQCYIGKSQREMCCCEALLLEYDPEEPQSLFNQVSIWLESDLPIYHWFHRMPVKIVKNKYLGFVKNAKRILFDSGIESDDYKEIPLHDSWRIRDLADARMLPVKQSIGQILSTYDPQSILGGLQSIMIEADVANQAHGIQIGSWLNECLSNANARTKQSLPAFEREASLIKMTESNHPKKSIKVIFEYNNDQQFSWSLCKAKEETVSQAHIAGRSASHNSTLQQSGAETILAEAMFFGS